MAEKHVTLSQLKMMAEKELSDTVTRIDELKQLVAEGRNYGITVTLSSANWSDSKQTIQNDYFIADSGYWYIVGGDADCLTECGEDGIRADNVSTDGQMIFYCDNVPENDLTVNILRLEVEI